MGNSVKYKTSQISTGLMNLMEDTDQGQRTKVQTTSSCRMTFWPQTSIGNINILAWASWANANWTMLIKCHQGTWDVKCITRIIKVNLKHQVNISLISIEDWEVFKKRMRLEDQYLLGRMRTWRESVEIMCLKRKGSLSSRIDALWEPP